MLQPVLEREPKKEREQKRVPQPVLEREPKKERELITSRTKMKETTPVSGGLPSLESPPPLEKAARWKVRIR